MQDASKVMGTAANRMVHLSYSLKQWQTATLRLQRERLLERETGLEDLNQKAIRRIKRSEALYRAGSIPTRFYEEQGRL